MNGEYTTGSVSIEDSTITQGLNVTASLWGTSPISIERSTISAIIPETDFAISVSSPGTGLVTILESYIDGSILISNNFNVSAPPTFLAFYDSVVTGNIEGNANGIIVDTNAPTITLTTEEIEITEEEDFDLLSGVSVTRKVGRQTIDMIETEEIQINGTLGENPGEYDIEYVATTPETSVNISGDTVVVLAKSSIATRRITRVGGSIPQPVVRSARSGSMISSRAMIPVTDQFSVLPTTVEGLQALLVQLQQQLVQLLAQTPAVSQNPFTQDLTLNSQGEDVTQLQQILISKGYSIPAGATGFFGEQTRQALINFQQSNNITPAVGYFGPMTRGRITQ